jgi:hypothetical protein
MKSGASAGRIIRCAAIVALAAASGACRSVTAGGSACTAEVVPGIAVAVRDQATGAPAAQDAVGTITSGTYSEHMRLIGSDNGAPLVLGGADEREGTYTVRITKTGYQPWEQSNVRVVQGVCHVITTEILATLVPTG